MDAHVFQEAPDTVDGLKARVRALEQENSDLEISLEVTTEHADEFEKQLMAIRNNLEQEVDKRTAEIAQKNKLLEQEVQERREMEIALREAKEAAEAANKAKSNFMASMSHELRTPLNAIIGYSELLEEDLIDIRHTELLPDVQRIHASGVHLLGLINDVLDISKIEAGKMQLYIESFNVQSMLDEVTEIITPMAHQQNNELLVERPGGELGGMRGDQVKTKQMLLNLLSNACKFTENGKVLLRVERKSDPSCDWLHFEVTDEGIGMTREQLSKLFQPFTQADQSTTRKYGGTGLGLAITRRFAFMLNGSIDVVSELGQGSTFRLMLPSEIDAANQSVAS